MAETIRRPHAAAFDPEKFRQTTRAQWEAPPKRGTAGRRCWHAGWAGDRGDAGHGRRRARARGSSTSPPARESRRSPRRAASGPTGHVLATDISPAILRFALRRSAGRPCQRRNARARRRAARHAARSLLRRGDLARRPDLFSRPAARACRHPPCAQARRALRRGGVFDPREAIRSSRCRWASSAAARSCHRRLPGQPGPFSLGAEGVLAKTLEQAGFRDVEVRKVDSPVRLPTAAECVRFERESFGALHQMMAG